MGEVIGMKVSEITEAINGITNELQRETASNIVRCFTEVDLPIKIKRFSRSNPNDRYRILCFVQKNKESVVINTDMWGFKGMAFQMRIFNIDSFKRLDELSGNVRDQILNGRDCGFCWSKCDGRQYTFSYGERDYIKCQNFGCNFIFRIADENDAGSLISLVKREIDLLKLESKEKNHD